MIDSEDRSGRVDFTIVQPHGLILSSQNIHVISTGYSQDIHTDWIRLNQLRKISKFIQGEITCLQKSQ